MIIHSTISLSRETIFFQKLLMTSLHVICGLSPSPKSKIVATRMTVTLVGLAVSLLEGLK